MKSNPQAAAQKWANAMANASTAYTEGVQAVSVPPGQAAARQQGAYVANVQANAGKWANNVAAVPLNEWQSAAVNKGAPRLATGAAQAQGKFTTFLQALLQYEQAGLNSLPPRGTFEQNLGRMSAWANYMHKFQKPAGT